MFGRRHHSHSTAVGHFLTFVKATLEEMEEYSEVKGRYLIVDHAHTHSSQRHREVHTVPWMPTRSPYPYSSELNPIEQFSPMLRERSSAPCCTLALETHSTRIAEVCDNLYLRNFHISYVILSTASKSVLKRGTLRIATLVEASALNRATCKA